jgi:hypothetical protein
MGDLTSIAKTIAEKFAARLPERERDTLVKDLAQSKVEPATGSEARVYFLIPGYERPEARGQHVYGVEGRVKDEDGSVLCVLLHADENDRVLELELVRFDEGTVKCPDWSTLELW